MAFDPDKFLEEDNQSKKNKIIAKNDLVSEELKNSKQYINDLLLQAPDPIHIASAYRSPETNRKVGGVPNSKHLTGDAFDIRKIGDQARNLEYLRSNGMTILDEGDHFHVQPKSLKSSFDPDKFLQEDEVAQAQPGPVPPVATTSEGSRDISLKDQAKSFLSGMGRALPGSDWASALGKTAIKQQIQGLRGQPLGLKDLLENIKSEKEAFTKRREKEEAIAPEAAIAGSILPNLALWELGTTALSKVPALASVPNGGMVKNAMKMGARGGLAQSIIGQLQEGPDINRLPIDFALGAGGELVGSGISKAIGMGAGAIKRGIESGVLPKSMRSSVESIPLIGGFLKGSREANEAIARRTFDEGEAIKRAEWDKNKQQAIESFKNLESKRKNAYLQEKALSIDDIKKLSPADEITVGDKFVKAIKDSDLALGKEYKAAVDPVLKKYGLKKASPQVIRDELNSILLENGLLDTKGNILRSELDEVLAPTRKNFLSKLIDISEGLQKNPSIQKLNKVTQDLQSLANFGALNRSSEEKMFGSLARKSRESLLENLEQVAKGNDFEILKSAKQKYAQAAPVFEQLRPLAEKFPEQITKSAGSQLPQSFIKDVLVKQPQLKSAIADVVMNNIISKSTTPKAMQSVIDNYGRDTLKNLLGKQAFEKLISAEKRFIDANKGFARGAAPRIDPFIRGQIPIDPPGKMYERLLNIVNKFQKRAPGGVIRYLPPGVSTITNQ